MFKQRALIIAQLFILMTALSYTAVFAQDEETQFDHNGPVAIVVVDVFEPYGKLFPIPSEHTGQNPPNCTLIPEGMDDYQYGGGSLVDYTTAGAPMQDIHGRLVYSEIQSLLRRRGAMIESHTMGTAPIRDIEIWRWREDDGDEDTDDDVVVLAAFDVSDENLKYDTAEVNNFLQDALSGGLDLQIDPLGLNTEIQSYVINMSFGLIPCDHMPGLTAQEYLDYLASLASTSEYYETLLGRIEELAGPLAGMTPEELAEAIFPIFSLPEFTPFLNEVFNNESLENNMRQQVQEALIDFYGPFEGNPDDILAYFAADPLMTFINDGFTDNGEQSKRLRGAPAQVSSPNYIMVASAGNEGLPFPYAPAIADNVVSVSADYPDVDVCRNMLTAAGTGDILSNDGEIMMNGFFNCLPGTSFAAPKLSFEMALYLLRGGDTTCDGLQPPLAYEQTLPNQWLNIRRNVAANLHCSDFNHLVDTP